MPTTRRGFVRAAAVLPAVSLLRAEPKPKLSAAVDQATAKAFRELYRATRKHAATSQHLRSAADMLELQFAHMGEVGLIAELEPMLAAAPAALQPNHIEALRAMAAKSGDDLPDDLVARMLQPLPDARMALLRRMIAREGMVKMNAHVVGFMRGLARHLEKTRGGFLASNGPVVLRPVQSDSQRGNEYESWGWDPNYYWGSGDLYTDFFGVPNAQKSGWEDTACWYAGWAIGYLNIVFLVAGFVSWGASWGLIGVSLGAQVLFC